MQPPGEPNYNTPANAWLRRILRFCISIRLRPGRNYRVNYTPTGTFLDIDDSVAGGRASLYRVVSMQGDHLVCRSWNGTTPGTVDVNIAKPDKLRHSIATETLRTVVVNYSSYSTANQTRLATGGSSSETQYVTPPYLVNDLIWAINATTTVSVTGTPLSLLDLNISARAWAQF